MISYSALMDMMVVSVPAPARSGNAKGTTEADAVAASSSSLKICTPRSISNAINPMSMLPATANDFISTPIKVSNFSPKKRKAIIITPETKVASAGRIGVFSLIAIMRGIEPITSITANNIRNADKI